MDSLIKWTGSKRYLATQLSQKIPIGNNYYEPFLGAGHVLLKVIEQNKFKKYFASDNCSYLIDIWKTVKNNPKALIDNYNSHWTNSCKEYYYQVRKEFNQDKDFFKFYYLTRTCQNGLIRFNRSGEFNSAFHHTRKGSNPNKIAKIILQVSNLVKDVEFACCDYREIQPSTGDFVFLDPPYVADSMYDNNFDVEIFFNYVNALACDWLLTYNGRNQQEGLVNFNCKESGFLQGGRSSFRALQKKEVIVQEKYFKRYAFPEGSNSNGLQG